MRDLRPELRRAAALWGPTEQLGEAGSIDFDCPGCADKPWTHRIWCPFIGRYETRGPAWTLQGGSIDDMSFVDAPGHSRSVRMMSGCLSHFNVTAGAIEFYEDSGHTRYRGPPMAETTDQTDKKADAPETAQAEAAPPKPAELPIQATSPPGYLKTLTLKFFGGVLHQLHESPHPGEVPAKVWVPIPGQDAPA